MSKKTVLKLDIHCDKCKRKALKTVAGVPGVDSVAIDMKEKKITVIGEADPVCLTTKLRKFGFTELLAVGPAKEEKKDDKKQGDQKKDDQKKDAVGPTVVYLPKSCNRCDGCYALSDETPNACRIS